MRDSKRNDAVGAPILTTQRVLFDPAGLPLTDLREMDIILKGVLAPWHSDAIRSNADSVGRLAGQRFSEATLSGARS
jgi:hypothetical protein